MTTTANSTKSNSHAALRHWNILGMSTTVSIFVTLTGLTLVMFLFNIFGLMGLNLIPFFSGAIIIVAVSTSLAAVSTAGAIGAIIAFLKDEDASQGSVAGISMLGKIIWGLLLGWFILAGFLSTWSFSDSPMAFFYLAAAAMTAMVVVQFYNITTGKWLVTGVLLYCGIIAFLALSSTSPTMVRLGKVFEKAKEATVSRLEGKSPTEGVPDPVTVQVLENDKYHSLPIGRNFHQVFIIPANGAYFSPTESPCAVGYNDALFISTGVGHKEDPWSITQVIPKSGTATQGRIHLNCK